MIPSTTVKIKRENISERVLAQISENLLEDLYLIFHAESSLNLTDKFKDQIMYAVVTHQIKDSIIEQKDFKKFYKALANNIRSNLEYMRHVKKTGLLPVFFKEKMIINLMLDHLNHEIMSNFPEEDLDDEILCQYDEVISMYRSVPPVEDPLGRELRIQLHIIKNSQLQFADPEKKAELLEELLSEADQIEFREFFIINALHRAMDLAIL